MLRRRAADAGVAGDVSFDAGYRGLDALADLIAAASVVVLPYDSPDQVTSGVLVDAVAAGRPVVATAFPHAVELLGSGAGIVVPRRDPAALAAALRRVLTEPGLADGMAARGPSSRSRARLAGRRRLATPRSETRSATPCSIARRCSHDGLRANLRPPRSLTDGSARSSTPATPRPRREHGYCTDDIARVLVVTLREPDPTPEVRELTRGAFRFVAEAQGVTGDTRNRRAASGRWHGRRSVEDCWGRSLWAFGAAVERRADWLGRRRARRTSSEAREQRSPWPRSMAYAALGAAAVAPGAPTPRERAGAPRRRRRR